MSDHPYVITIHVIEGDPDGVRTVEKSNWTGRGIVFTRGDLPRAIESGISASGVYVLVGEDPDEKYDQRIYVGQADDVGKRLKQHQADDTKDYWAETVVFVSAAEPLNRAHTSYLESQLIRLARDAGRAETMNANQPTAPSLAPTDRTTAEGFLREVLTILPVLGISAFHTVKAASSDAPTSHVRYFLKGPDAEGQGEERSDGFLVFAGATARIEETPSLSPSSKRIRRRLRDSGVLRTEDGVLRLAEDTSFGSPSTAAKVLLGRPANGRLEWKDERGITLKQHQVDAAETAGSE